MEKLNSKYVESVVKKAAEGKIVAVRGEMLWNTVQIEKRREARGTKRKVGRPARKPGANHPWKRMVISTKKYHGNK